MIIQNNKNNTFKKLSIILKLNLFINNIKVIDIFSFIKIWIFANTNAIKNILTK